MTPTPSSVAAAISLDTLADLVNCESPSGDTAATARCADLLSDRVHTTFGSLPERLESSGRVHLRWQFGEPRVLLLGHLDTVWPVGTTSRWPFEVDGDRATGPGVFDMKAGVVQLFAALATLPDPSGVAVLITSDEEIGSPTSQELIASTATGLEAVLVLEPSADGALKVARKGVATFAVDITGRAAHAGLEPENGVNAAVEAAHQIITISRLGRPKEGTTVTPTLLTAGTTANTVPGAARITVDVRAETTAEMRRVESALGELQARLPGASLASLTETIRPPLERQRAERLFELAARIAAELGMAELRGTAVGGGSDGNLTAALGVDTLDGLGAVGGNAHAEGEWIQVSAIAERTALVVGMLTALLEDNRSERSTR